MSLCTSCHGDVKPVVALDIDGTLGNYHQHAIDFYVLYFNRPEMLSLWQGFDGSMELSDWLEIPKSQYQEAKLAFRSGGYKRWMPMYSGADTLAKAIIDAGAELWITTTRPWMRLDNVDPDTREWLKRNGIPYHHLLFDEDKYAVLQDRVGHERIVAILEDEMPQIERCCELELPVILRRTNWNSSMNHWHSVRSLIGATSYITSRINYWKEVHQ